MPPLTIGRYKRIFYRSEAELVPYNQWELVLNNGAGGEALRDGCGLLHAFEGCWVKLDAMFFRLKKVAEPPGWSFFATDKEWYWFRLGQYHGIYLPRE